MCTFALQLGKPVVKPGMWSVFTGMLKETFDFSAILQKDHYMFAVRNFLAIMICFLLGAHDILAYDAKTGSKSTTTWIFRDHSSAMAGTLCLLLSRFQGAAFDKNLKRLLGVVLGRVTPLLLEVLIGALPCEQGTVNSIAVAYESSTTRFFVQFVALALCITVCEYVAYSSKSWAYVGALMAGFGCFGLLTVPACKADSKVHLDVVRTGSYKEIIEITTCIFVQMLVDTSLTTHSARSLTTHTLSEATNKLKEALSIFYNDSKETHPILAMRGALKQCSDFVSKTELFCENAKPNMDVAPGMKTPFKVDLCNSACDSLKLLLSDVNLLLVASQSGLNTWRCKENNTKVYAEESVDGKIVDKLEKGSIEHFRQRGPFLIRSEAFQANDKQIGFVDVNDMELVSQGRVITRPLMMDLPRVQASFDHNELGFVKQKMEGATKLLIDTLNKEDESALESDYLTKLNTSNVYSLDEGQETREMLANIFSEVNQTLGGGGQADGTINRLLTDDRTVRGCVMAVAINNLKKHFADMDSASIAANIH